MLCPSDLFTAFLLLPIDECLKKLWRKLVCATNCRRTDAHTHTHTHTPTCVYICLGTQSCLTLVTPRTVAHQAPLSIYAYIKINIYYYLCYTCVNHSLLNSFAGNIGLNFYILLCLVIYKKNYVAYTVANFIIFLKVLSNCIPEGLCEGAKLSLS